MLTSFPAPASLLAPIAPSPASVTAAPSESSGVKLASYAVSSAPLEARVENQLRSATQSPAATPLETLDVSSPAASGGFQLASSLSAGSPNVRYSSEFLAQILAQLPTSANETLQGQLSTETVPTSVLDSRLIELFGQVKYKPSNAFKPSSPAPDIAALLAAAEKASVQKQASPAYISAPPAATTFAPRAANSNERIRAADNDNRASYTLRAEPSLVRRSGTDAYGATNARNSLYLRAPVATETVATETPDVPVIEAVSSVATRAPDADQLKSAS